MHGVRGSMSAQPAVGRGRRARRPEPDSSLRILGDRRGSNPRPSLEPQSADTRFWELPGVAEIVYLRRFPCSRLLAVSASCALSGVKSGVRRPPTAIANFSAVL